MEFDTFNSFITGCMNLSFGLVELISFTQSKNIDKNKTT